MELSYDGFVECLCRCAYVKYSSVPSMALVDRVSGLLLNLVGSKDEADVIGEATEQATPPVFDAMAEAVPLVGETEAEFAHWLACWERLRLSTIHGFPLWLREVHEILHESFRELRKIFSYYCTDDSHDDEEATSAALTIGLHEWWSMMVDCRVLTDRFSEAVLVSCFDRSSRGYSELGLPGLIESLVRVAFARANPEMARLRVGAPPPESIADVQPVPGCLRRLIAEKIMPLAKQDKQLFMSEAIASDEAVQEMLRRDETKSLLKRLLREHGSGGDKPISMKQFTTLLASRDLLRTWQVRLCDLLRTVPRA